MSEYITTDGMILKTSNLGEYDKRLVILTADRGKITVFARGVRRQDSRYLAACSPFSFGTLRAFPGRNAYSFMDFSVKNYFEPLRTDFEVSCLGMYFLEVADYYTRENNDDAGMLKLLYVSVRALERIISGQLSIKKELVRYVFEIKAIVVNGEFPGSGVLEDLSPDARYTIDYIASSSERNLFAFEVSEGVLGELERAAGYYRDRFLGNDFKSLELIDI